LHIAGPPDPVARAAPLLFPECRPFLAGGRALDRLRADGERTSEEIDVVGAARSRVTVVGECKWTGGRMTGKVLSDLESYKIPALRQAGARFAAGGPTILLFSKSGFKDNLAEEVAGREDVRLIDLAELDRDLVEKLKGEN
jgi:hypothetical protein